MDSAKNPGKQFYHVVFSVKKLGNLDLQLLNLPAVKDIFRQGVNPLEIVFVYFPLVQLGNNLIEDCNKF